MLILASSLFFILVTTIITTNHQDVFIPDISLSYCNPFVILEAASIFLLFDRIKVSEWFGKMINMISPCVFCVYVLQEYVVKRTDNPVVFEYGVLSILFYLFAIIVITFAAGWVVFKLFNFVENRTIDKLLNKIDFVIKYERNLS